MFAIDGCKMPSNASKQWSGKHADLEKKHKKIDRAVRRMLKKHREDDTLSVEIVDRERQQIEKIKAASQKIKKHLTVHAKRVGVSGKEVQSNITDNDSAKMKTSHGVIQGYTGVAAVDDKHQVIVAAQAYGQGQEHGLLQPMIEQAHTNLGSSNRQKRKTKITADSGYHNKDTLEYLDAQKHDAYIADVGFRSRDPRFKDYKDHKDKKRLRPKKQFKNEDFNVNRTKLTCTCPAGKTMWLKSKVGTIAGYQFLQFQAHEHDCPSCPMKERCLRNPEQKSARQVNFKIGQTIKHKDSVIECMKKKIDSTQGRYIYGKRLGTVEPVFGHINTMIGIKRFSLRGKRKVNAQWQLMSALHNILKIHRYGWEW